MFFPGALIKWKSGRPFDGVRFTEVQGTLSGHSRLLFCSGTGRIPNLGSAKPKGHAWIGRQNPEFHNFGALQLGGNTRNNPPTLGLLRREKNMRDDREISVSGAPKGIKTKGPRLFRRLFNKWAWLKIRELGFRAFPALWFHMPRCQNLSHSQVSKGYGSKIKHQGTTGLSPWLHLPGFY